MHFLRYSDSKSRNTRKRPLSSPAIPGSQGSRWPKKCANRSPYSDLPEYTATRFLLPIVPFQYVWEFTLFWFANLGFCSIFYIIILRNLISQGVYKSHQHPLPCSKKQGFCTKMLSFRDSIWRMPAARHINQVQGAQSRYILFAISRF